MSLIRREEKRRDCVVVAKRRSNLHYINFLSVFKMHSSHTHHSRAPRAAYFCAAAAVNLISGALIICATKFNFFFGRVEQVRSRA